MIKDKLKDLYWTECKKEAQNKIDASINKQIAEAKERINISNKLSYITNLK